MAETDSTEGRSTGIIIAVVAVSVLSMLCCGCLALAFIFGDFAVQILEQFAALVPSLF